MPADTVASRNSGQLLPQDISHLRAVGLEWEAEELQQKVQRQQDQSAANESGAPEKETTDRTGCAGAHL